MIEETKQINQPKEVVLPMSRVNALALLLIPVVMLFYSLPAWLLYGRDFFAMGWQELLAFPFSILLILLLSIIAHEGLHGLTWALFAKQGWQSIRFGIKWEVLTPYTHCKEPLGYWKYIIGGAMPGLLMGLIPYLVSLAFRYEWLFYVGAFNTIAAGGDMLSIYWIIRFPKTCRFRDHESEVGFWVEGVEDGS